MPIAPAPSHFQKLRDWSERKHAILKEYLPAFCRAISSQARGGTIWYVDGYAGAGVYQDSQSPDSPGAEGSPVLAARITEQLPYTINCINVEEDQDNFDSLQRETARFSHVENIRNDFNAVVEDVLARVAGSPAFFFLDSFGTKELPMDGLVDRIAMRRNPTDVLLRYATSAVRRLAASYEKDPIRGGANARNLDKWFRGQGWRPLIEQYTGNDRDNALLTYYLGQLVSISNGRLSFACDYPIRSTDGLTKYHLVFATGNRLGMKLMSDILFVAETKYAQDHAAHRTEKEVARRNGQLSLFDPPAPDPDAETHERIAGLKEAILAQVQQGEPHWEFDNLRCTLIKHGWFARFTEKDFRAACKELHTEGKIQRISSGKAWSRETEFTVKQ